ncbi:hypothetical protein BASA60_010311, partial [Batrachochytrium salamandrivorans]
MKDEEMRKRLLDEARQRTMERIATEEQNFKLNNYKIPKPMAAGDHEG